MSGPLSYPKTPPIHPTSAAQNMFSDALGSPSGSSSCSGVCQGCTTPPLPNPMTPTNMIPSIELGSFATLEDRFLRTLSMHSTSPTHTQAVATVPNDRWAAGHWLLVDLLCHRAFATFGNQDSIRQFSTLHYQRFGPGDTLTITVRLMAQGWLTWLEATITRDDVLIATASGLDDGPNLQPDDLQQDPDYLADDFRGLTTFYVPEDAPDNTG